MGVGFFIFCWSDELWNDQVPLLLKMCNVKRCSPLIKLVGCLNVFCTFILAPFY